METFDQKLENLIIQAEILYLDSINMAPLEKKIENYRRGMEILNEASQILNEIEYEISNLNSNDEIIQIQKINEIEKMICLLSLPNLKLSEILHIVKKLKCIYSSLPNTAHVDENMNNLDNEKN